MAAEFEELKKLNLKSFTSNFLPPLKRQQFKLKRKSHEQSNKLSNKSRGNPPPPAKAFTKSPKKHKQQNTKKESSSKATQRQFLMRQQKNINNFHH